MNADGSDIRGITFDGYGYLPLFFCRSPVWKPAP